MKRSSHFNFGEFLHKAVHRSMELNDKYYADFRIGEYGRWNYDFDTGKLTFSHDGTPRVEADIEVIGTESLKTKTWLWSRANHSIPDHLKSRMGEVLEFGRRHHIEKITNDYWPCDEYDGWEMTALTVTLLSALGSYRCPDENGYLYVVLSSIRFVG